MSTTQDLFEAVFKRKDLQKCLGEVAREKICNLPKWKYCARCRRIQKRRDSFTAREVRTAGVGGERERSKGNRGIQRFSVDMLPQG